MIASLYIANEKLLQMQELVKCHNLRFCGEPLVSGSRTYVRVSSEHLPPGGGNAFFADWDRLNRPVVEVRPASWKRMLRKVWGRVLSVLPD